MEKKKVVIIGGGFAGIRVAKKIKNKNMQVLLIDKKNHHLFQPLLYQVASATLSPADIAYPLREIFKGQKNVTVLMGEVTKIDKERRKIFLGEEALDYDYLVIATGARHSYFGHQEWEKYAPGLKTLTDALGIREKTLLSFEKAERAHSTELAQEYMTFVVIGAGPTGVEMAGAIAEIASSTLLNNYRNINTSKTLIYLLEAASRVLPPFPPKLSEKAQKDLEKMGVKVLINTKVTNINEHGVQTETSFIPAKNIIWAAGNQASSILKDLGSSLDRQGRVMVEKDLSVPHHPEIFVIGDACCFMDKEGKPLPAVATTAIQQGAFVGKMLNKLKPFEERKGFNYFDKGSLATIGKYKAVGCFRNFNFSGILAWIVWAFIHIFYLVGFRNRYSVMLEWYFHYFTNMRGARLIHQDLEK
jgi:NADH dehydrogenase